jgi:Phage tail lysozyme
MAQAEVIKEFLVSLGFKTDQKSLKEFSGGIENATKSVVKLVAAIQGAALTVGAGVAAFASNLEALYFAAQRTGNSATGIKAFEKAMQNFGASSGEALSSIQAIANFMRYTPGAEGFMKSLGVDTRDANGNLRETVDVMTDLGQVLAKKTTWEQKAYGDMLGLSDNVLRALVNGDFAREMDAQKERLKNNGFDKASKDAHKFMMGLRELQTYLEAFGLKVQDALMNKLGVSMDKLSDWFNLNGPKIAQRVADIIVLFMAFAEKIGPAIQWLVEKLIALDDATGGWSTKIIALLALLNVLGGATLISGILSLAGAFVSLGTAIAGAEAAAGTGLAGGGLLAKLGPLLGRLGVGGALLFHSGGLNEGEDEELRKYRNKGSTDSAMAFFMSMGWTKAQAAGIVSNLRKESNLDAGAVGDDGQAYGVAQWHPDRQRAFARWAGKDIRQSNIQEQLGFVNYELTQGAESRAGGLLRATNNARQAGEIVSRNYERPANADIEAGQRGLGAVHIEQTTNINVAGSGDPVATGKAVANEQDRVHQNLTRNLQSSVH